MQVRTKTHQSLAEETPGSESFACAPAAASLKRTGHSPDVARSRSCEISFEGEKINSKVFFLLVSVVVATIADELLRKHTARVGEIGSD